MLKSIIVSSAVVVASSALVAQAAVSFTGSTLTENFDGLPNTGSTATFSATVGVQSVATGSAFEGTRVGGSGSGTMNLVADNGTANSGAIYSYGATGTAERALGSVASGTNIAGFGVEIVNNATAAIDSITIQFTQENWRSSTSLVNTTNAQYSFGAAGSTSYLTATGFTDVDALDLVGPAPVAANGLLDGNTAANQAARSATISFATPIPVGSSFYLRFTDANDTGNDAGLAIDNFSLSATTVVPEPTSLAALGLLGLVAVRRRA